LCIQTQTLRFSTCVPLFHFHYPADIGNGVEGTWDFKVLCLSKDTNQGSLISLLLEVHNMPFILFEWVSPTANADAGCLVLSDLKYEKLIVSITLKYYAPSSSSSLPPKGLGAWCLKLFYVYTAAYHVKPSYSFFLLFCDSFAIIQTFSAAAEDVQTIPLY